MDSGFDVTVDINCCVAAFKWVALMAGGDYCLALAAGVGVDVVLLGTLGDYLGAGLCFDVHISHGLYTALAVQVHAATYAQIILHFRLTCQR